MSPALAALDREIAGFTRKLDADTTKAGQQAGQNLGDGVARTGLSRLRAHVREFAGIGRAFGAGMGDGLREEFPKGLRSVGERVKTWGREQVSQARRVGGQVGGSLADGMKSGVNLLRGPLQAGGRLLTGFAVGGVAALTAVTGAATVMGASVASSNEQATISFTTMLRKAGDTEQTARKRAQAFIGDLQKLAATTPFEFADLQDYSSKLVSAGVDANKIIPILKNLGDVTSGTGTGAEGINRSTVALQQMIAAQKISAEDLNQLRDAGIPVYDLLAGATGKSKKEIVDLANQGKLGKKELDALLDTLSSDAPKGLEKFSGLMKNQSSTLAGMWSNLTDTVSQGLGRVGTRAMPELKKGLGGISGLLSDLFKYLDEHGDDIERIFKSGGRAAHTFWGLVKPVLKAFVGGVGDGQDVLTSFADWLDTHQEQFAGFFVGAGKASIAFGKVVAMVISGVLRALGGLTTGFGAAMAFMQDRLAIMNDNMAELQDGLGFHDAANKSRAKAQQYRDDAKVTRADSSAKSATDMADALDNKLIPGLDAANDALDKYGQKAKEAAAQGDVWRGSLNGISRSVEENGHSLSDHTKKGKANRAAIQKSIEAMNDDAQAAYDNKAAKGDLAGAEKAAAKVIRNGTSDIKDQAKKAGLNKDAVDGMIDKIKKVPTEHHTDITFSTNAGKVLVKLKTVGSSSGKTLNDGEHDGQDSSRRARGGITQGRAAGGMVPGHTPLHMGDDVLWPRLDGKRQPLRGGEGVQVTEAMDSYEQRRLTAMNAGVLGGLSAARVRQNLGESDGLAKGGMIGRSAVPASVNDLGPAATDFAVRNARLAAQVYAEETRKALQGVADRSGGGNTAAALAYARRNEGHPYVFGTIWDCSGLVGTLQNIAEGKGVGGRRYSTPAFHGAKAEGFTRNKESNFKIGVNPNPGKSGHMVAELDGVPVEEAGGVGLRVGGSARRVTDPMFSWRGGLAYGGRVVGGREGDMPMDLISRRGQRYSPILSDLAAALASGRGYGDGTLSAAAGFHWTGEKAAELVVNPQMRHYTGGEKVLQVSNGKSGSPAGGPLVGTVNFTGSGTRDDLQQLAFSMRAMAVGRAGRRA